MSDRILKWLTTMADRLGVGLNREQLTMRTSTSVGESASLVSTSSTARKSTMRASTRASSIVRDVSVDPG